MWMPCSRLEDADRQREEQSRLGHRWNGAKFFSRAAAVARDVVEFTRLRNRRRRHSGVFLVFYGVRACSPRMLATRPTAWQ